MILLSIALIIELAYSPRLGRAENHLLLWYGKTNRKYLVLLKNDRGNNN